MALKLDYFSENRLNIEYSDSSPFKTAAGSAE